MSINVPRRKAAMTTPGDSEQSAEIDMRISGPASHLVFCSLGKATYQARSAYNETTCRSSLATWKSRRPGRKVRKSENLWAFFQRMSTGERSRGQCSVVSEKEEEPDSRLGVLHLRSTVHGPQFPGGFGLANPCYQTTSAKSSVFPGSRVATKQKTPASRGSSRRNWLRFSPLVRLRGPITPEYRRAYENRGLALFCVIYSLRVLSTR
jgi:hypothetical protein